MYNRHAGRYRLFRNRCSAGYAALPEPLLMGTILSLSPLGVSQIVATVSLPAQGGAPMAVTTLSLMATAKGSV